MIVPHAKEDHRVHVSRTKWIAFHYHGIRSIFVKVTLWWKPELTDVKIAQEWISPLFVRQPAIGVRGML